jgi:hypothetical protein
MSDVSVNEESRNEIGFQLLKWELLIFYRTAFPGLLKELRWSEQLHFTSEFLDVINKFLANRKSETKLRNSTSRLAPERLLSNKRANGVVTRQCNGENERRRCCGCCRHFQVKSKDNRHYTDFRLSAGRRRVESQKVFFGLIN